MEDIYRSLARHLDDLPGGYPPTADGVELRILRRLFSSREAELAVNLTLIPEPPRIIARRAGLDIGEARARLEEMARKGLIVQTRPGKTGPFLYQALQFVIGIWELQVNRLNPELIRDVNAYIDQLLDTDAWKRVPQLRTIPVGRSLDHQVKAMTYERAEALVRTQKKFLVAPCICRQERSIMGDGCGRLPEACLIFGQAADLYERNGIGRIISLAETLDILEEAERSALVLQPINARHAVNICCCCGCCCGVLRTLKRQPRPADLFSSAFRAKADPAACQGCGLCLDRCQMGAITMQDDRVVLDEAYCIGCGLCVTTCPAGALRLTRKPEHEQKKVPRRMEIMFYQLARIRGRIDFWKTMRLLARSTTDNVLTLNQRRGDRNP